MQLTTILALGLIFGVGIFIVVLGVIRRPPVTTGEIVAERLQDYRGERLTLEEIELQRPMVDRVLRPLLDWLAKLIASRTPEQARINLENQLILAGRPGGLSASEFTAVRYGLGIGLCICGALVGMLTGSSLLVGILGIGGGVLGMYFPIFYVRQRIIDRGKQIQRGLPDVLDLLTVCVEAGLSFDAAISRVTEKFDNALSTEFGQVLQETRLGRPRLEALDAMGRRCKVDDLHSFVQAVIQSEQMGVGIAKILRIQSEEIRRKRRQRVQELAAKASLKMMMPMVGCIFPTLWIVILGPAVLILLKFMGIGPPLTPP